MEEDSRAEPTGAKRDPCQEKPEEEDRWQNQGRRCPQSFRIEAESMHGREYQCRYHHDESVAVVAKGLEKHAPKQNLLSHRRQDDGGQDETQLEKHRGFSTTDDLRDLLRRLPVWEQEFSEWKQHQGQHELEQQTQANVENVAGLDLESKIGVLFAARQQPKDTEIAHILPGQPQDD